MLHPMLQQHLECTGLHADQPPSAVEWQALLAHVSDTYTAAEQQRALLDALFDTLPDAIFVKDRAGHYVRMNQAHLRRLGVGDAAAAQGLTDADLLDPVDAAAAAAAEQQVLVAGEALIDQLDAYTRPDGTYGWQLSSRLPFRDGAGTVTGTLGIARDLTEFMRVQDAWNEVEVRYRALVENVPGTVYRRGSALGAIEFASSASATLLGYGSGAVPPLSALVAPADAAAAQTAIELALAQRQPYRVEYRVVDANGTLRWIGDRGRGVFSGAGELLWLDGVLFDYTSQKQAEAALVDAKLAAEAANQAKSMFLANMSHELRTPLNAILGYAELLSEIALDADNPVFVRDLKRIHAAGSHLLTVLNDILDLARIETGRTELHIDQFLVSDLIAAVVSASQPLVERSGNALDLDVAAGLGVMQSDSVRLRKILGNLLDNAAKFTSAGTVSLAVTREPTSGGDVLRFVVADTGIGMAPDEISRLFQPFVQADLSNTRAYGGTGLGLALCRRLCDLLGGTIDVASEPGVGSRFTVVVPAVRQ